MFFSKKPNPAGFIGFAPKTVTDQGSKTFLEVFWGFIVVFWTSTAGCCQKNFDRKTLKTYDVTNFVQCSNCSLMIKVISFSLVN